MINNIVKKFLEEYEESVSSNWQSTKINYLKNPICELEDVFFKLESKKINKNISADLPWAEDHFQERICGEPINPGSQYKNWPYWDSFSEKAFKDKGVFDHNYMERIWCKGLSGKRFNYGDLNDIIERLNKDKNTRQAFLSIWHPEDQSNNEGKRVPCTLGYWFKKDNKDNLNITYLIRSCDIVRHFRNDIYMTNRLLEHVSEKVNLKPGLVKIWVGNLHCFKSDLYFLKKNYVRNTNN